MSRQNTLQDSRRTSQERCTDEDPQLQLDQAEALGPPLQRQDGEEEAPQNRLLCGARTRGQPLRHEAHPSRHLDQHSQFLCALDPKELQLDQRVHFETGQEVRQRGPKLLQPQTGLRYA